MPTLIFSNFQLPIQYFLINVSLMFQTLYTGTKVFELYHQTFFPHAPITTALNDTTIHQVFMSSL